MKTIHINYIIKLS